MLPTTITLRRPPTGASRRLILRAIHGRRQQRDPPSPVSHGVENYFVDGDETPPPNNPIYKVDATSEATQSAYEPPSGPWSRAGPGTEEYRTISKDDPYDVPNDPDTKLRYGGNKRYNGPEGAGRSGRKPEGRA